MPTLVQPAARYGLPPHRRGLPDRRGAAAGIAARRFAWRRPVTQPFRLPCGGRIDRSRTLRFRFDGREYEGHPGDTLASALLANGVRVVARSWKFHRPRGIFAAGMEEPSALVQLDDEPNRRATDILLYDGLLETGQHASPSQTFDV